MKLSNLMLKLTKPLLTRAESEAIAVFRLSQFGARSLGAVECAGLGQNFDSRY
jgi:hypothetical protein